MGSWLQLMAGDSGRGRSPTRRLFRDEGVFHFTYSGVGRVATCKPLNADFSGDKCEFLVVIFALPVLMLSPSAVPSLSLAGRPRRRRHLTAIR